MVPRPRHKRRNQKDVDEFKEQFKKKLESFGKDVVIICMDEAHFTIDYMFLPTGAADIDPVEECWRQTRENRTANTTKELRTSLKSFWNK